MDDEKIRVLLVDDDQGDFEMTRAMMSQIDTREMKLEWVSTYEEGLDALEEGEHDVYLVDYFLEDRTGMDLLREARKRSIRAPLIMLTGRGNRQVDVQAMKAGAADYLVKGRIDPELLERSIRFALERSRAEQALRESEERHRGMFDHLPIGLYRSGFDGEFIDANPALVRLLGYPDRETLRNVYARQLYVSQEDRDRFREMLETYGVARGFESWLERFDGESIRVRNTSRIHRGADGEVEYVEGSVEDVTHLHRRAGEKGGDEARFRILFEEAGIGVAVVDRDGLIVEVNPAFHRIFGYAPEEAGGESFVDLAVEDDRAELLEAVRALVSGETPRSVSEHRFRARDGTVVWARTKLSSVPAADEDPEEGPARLLALLEDVSEAGGG